MSRLLKINWKQLALDRLDVCVSLRLEIEQLRRKAADHDTTVRQIGHLHAESHSRQMNALRDLLALFDRSVRHAGLARNCWTPADVERLLQIREISEGKS